MKTFVHLCLTAVIFLLTTLVATAQYDPRTNAFLQAWWSADTGAASNEHGVFLWADLSGRGHLLSGGTPRIPESTQVPPTGNPTVDNPVRNLDADHQPNLVPDAYNGKPTVRFNGNQAMTAANIYPTAPLMNLSNHTIVVVYRERLRTPGGGILGFRLHAAASVDGPPAPARASDNNSTNSLCFQQNSTRGVVFHGSDNTIDNRRYNASKLSVATIRSESKVQLFRNGQLIGEKPAMAAPCVVDVIAVSAHTQNSDLYGRAQNDICDILIYGAALSDSERQEVERMLMTKYALPEPGNLKLEKARRLFNDKTKVTAKFSKTVTAASANIPANYMIWPPIGVTEAVLQADNQTVLLTLDRELDEAAGTHMLQAWDVVDAEGKTLALANSEQPITADELMPLEIGRTVKGFVEDFPSPQRNSAWVPRGPAGDVYQQTYGFMRVQSGTGQFNHLNYEPQEPAAKYDPVHHSILARIRVPSDSLPLEFAVGLGVGLSPDERGGANYLLGNAGTSFVNDGKGTGPGSSFSWTPGTWYWMRVTNSATAVSGTIWKADGDTAEPAAQTFTYAAGAERSGFAGITAGINGGEFEIDWILIQAPNMPELAVTRPEPFAVALTVAVENDKVVLRWPVAGSEGYLLYRNMDLNGDSLTWEPFFPALPEDSGVEDGYNFVRDDLVGATRYFYQLFK